MIDYCKMQSSERISPDITCLSYTTNRSAAAVSVVAPNINSAHLNTIAEVPPGLYEFIIGSNGEVKILCKICQYMSNKKSNFKRHFTNMHFVQTEDASKMLECCGIRFTTKGEKFQHTKSVHKSGYKCTSCSKVFDRPALLQRHLAKHTGKKPYKCSLCSYQTPNKANAKRHIEKKHSDVQEGSILFVTDDGEQIQMEVVSKGAKDVDRQSSSTSSPSEQSTASVVKSNADSTSFGSNNAETTPLTAYTSSIILPRSRSASVTSSSLSPPGHLFVGPLSSVFDTPTAADTKVYGQDKRRKITHSIDTIMKQHAESHFIPTSQSTTPRANNSFNNTPCCTTTLLNEGNTASVSSPENLAKYSSNYDHPNINELNTGSYCSPNWSHYSSPLFPISNDYAVSNAHQNSFLQPSTYTSAAPTDVRNQGSPSFLFRQCTHGCWHHVDNQVASDSQSAFEKNSSSLIVPTHFYPHQSPDLRSSSSSISQQTENSSINSLKSEDENDSDVIDVVGDDDGGDDSSKRLQLLSSICEDLGSFSTTEIPSREDGNTRECKINHFECPPVAGQRRGSFSHGSPMEEQGSAAERYVPKKLRVARGHYK